MSRSSIQIVMSVISLFLMASRILVLQCIGAILMVVNTCMNIDNAKKEGRPLNSGEKFVAVLAIIVVILVVITIIL